ncbi:nuclear pore complex protein Nup153-like [Clavelina lepadiformis]|uniref:nuclear pore complex protein Nup153-like n=1 Tax=Clavelina lepadiformis TaxID=159417 RepID=UPI004041E704
MEQNNFLRKIWSSKSNSRQQPTAFSDKQPAFNLSSFSSPAPSISKSPTVGTSPSSFYSGRVQYGGAMSTSSPYRIPKITKVQGSSSNKTKTSGQKSSSQFTGALSSTARKIMQTLEKMSTPLRDLKKIPPPDTRTPTSFMARAHRKRTMDHSINSPQKKRVPPTKGLTSVSSAIVTTSAKMPLDNSLVTKSIVKNFVSESRQTARNLASSTKDHVIHRGQPAVVATYSSSEGLKHNYEASSGGGGGKMKHQRRAVGHYSAISQTPEKNVLPPVPNITMNIPTLPSFDFNGPGNTSTPAPPKLSKINLVKGKEGVEQKDHFDLEFVFSPPAPRPSPVKKSQPTPQKSSVTFPFKSPPDASSKAASLSRTTQKSMDQSSSAHTTKSIQTKTQDFTPVKAGSVMDILGKGDKISKTPLARATAVSTTSSAISKPPLSEVFGKSKDKWECGTCMIMNSNDRDKCEACQTPKPEAKSSKADSKPLSELFKKPAGKWECGTCMIMNDNSQTKCEACQTPKPGSQSSQPPLSSIFQKQKDRWECGTCMIMNDNSRSKCEACETPKPGASLASGSDSKPFTFGAPASQTKSSTTFTSNLANFKPSAKSSFSFGAPTSSPIVKSLVNFSDKNKWECPTCLITNDQSRMNCEACTTPKPGSESKSDKKGPASGIVFGINQSKSSKWDCKVCLVPNDAERTKCVACESPRTDLKNDSSANFQKSTFKFGSTSSNVVKFGIPTKPETKPTTTSSEESVTAATSENKIVTSIAPSFPAGIKFGVQQPSVSKEEPKPVASFVTTAVSSSPGAISQLLFGAPKTSTKPASTTPSFGTPTSVSSQPTAYSVTKKRNLDETDSTVISAKLPTFGVGGNLNTQTGSTASLVTGFTLTAPKTTQAVQQKPAFAGFNVGAKQTSEGFGATLNAQKPATSTTQTPSTAPPFLFGSVTKPASSVVTTTTTAAKPALFSGFSSTQSSFGAPPQSSATPPSFSFGKTPTSNASGSTVNDSSQPTKLGFSFGSTPASTAPSNGMFGKAAAPASNPTIDKPPVFGSTTAPATGFSFGSNASSSTTTQKGSGMFSTSQSVPKPTFNFGASAEPAQTGFQFASNPAQTATPAKAFSFGNSGQNQSVFSNPSASTSGFNFSGAQNKPAFSSTPGTFQFGAGSSNPPKPDSTSTGFQFNANPSLPTPAFGSTLGASPAPNAGGMFSIGQSDPNKQNRATTPVQNRPMRRATRRLRK